MDPKDDFFKKDRGERGIYEAAKPSDEVLLPLTRDGFEAILERATGLFHPPLPVDDSIRKVFAGYVHHMPNEISTITIEKVGSVLFKSISNALTWTLDQEIKQKAQQEIAEKQAKLRAEFEAQEAEKAKDKASEKRQRKAAKRVTIAESPDVKEAT